MKNKLLIGAIAGFAATIPMTILMVEWHRHLPRKERYPLPPREIFDELAHRAAIDDDLSEAQKTNFSLAGHFAYGALTGALYAPIMLGHERRSSALSGAIYGAAVWGASYLGWLPAFKILKPATVHPARRVMLMTSAHLLWGSALGIIAREIIDND